MSVNPIQKKAKAYLQGYKDPSQISKKCVFKIGRGHKKLLFHHSVCHSPGH